MVTATQVRLRTSAFRSPCASSGYHTHPGFISAKDWPRGAQVGVETNFFRLQEAPRALQEVLKRLFEGFRVEDAIGNQFWDCFGPCLGSPGASESRFECETSSKFCAFALFSSSRLRDPISDPLGLHFFIFWPPRWLKPRLEFFMKQPIAVQEGFFSSPKAVQVHSKRRSGPLQEALRPRRCKRPLGTDFKRFWPPT